MDLHWLDTTRNSYLHVGILELDIAYIVPSKSKLSWRLYSDLPGVCTVRNWNRMSREQMKRVVETIIRDWFDQANTHRPAMERPDND